MTESAETKIVDELTGEAVVSVQMWQNNLLPLMRWTLVALAFFFFATSCFQLVYLNQKILNTTGIDIEKAVFFPVAGPEQTYQQAVDSARLKALVMLEASATSDQYRQAGVLLAGRLWTTYLGFVTGMILAFVGATFVLGKLQEESSELKAKIDYVDLSLKSASPGLILAVLGVLLMICTILTHNNIDVTHRATYLSDGPVVSGVAPETPVLSTNSKPSLDLPKGGTSKARHGVVVEPPSEKGEKPSLALPAELGKH